MNYYADRVVRWWWLGVCARWKFTQAFLTRRFLTNPWEHKGPSSWCFQPFTNGSNKNCQHHRGHPFSSSKLQLLSEQGHAGDALRVQNFYGFRWTWAKIHRLLNEFSSLSHSQVDFQLLWCLLMIEYHAIRRIPLGRYRSFEQGATCGAVRFMLRTRFLHRRNK